MIINNHPILKLLDDSPWRSHLVGSRYVGVFDRDTSDYDFLVECELKDWHTGLKPWLEENNFKPENKYGLGYGPDNRLHGTCVWKHQESDFPDVDILPVTPKEAAMRLRFFAAMKKQGHKPGGLLALAMKREKTWATLWKVLATFEED